MTVLDPRLYLVLDPVAGPARPAEVLRAAVAGGVTAVQVRSPAATTRDLHDAAVAVRDLLAGTGVAVVVDDRLDVALAARVDGVHLGASDLPVDAARRVAGPGLSIGWSVTGPDDLAAPASAVVDLLGIGPVFATATKPEGGPGVGLSGLTALVDRARLEHPGVPAVAIGGVDPGNAASVLATGVDGLAVSSAIAAADDPRAVAAALRSAVDVRDHGGRARG